MPGVEADLEARACAYWTSLGFEARKLDGRGWPDRLLLGVYPLIAFVEFKRGPQESLVRKTQSDRLDRLRHRGFPTYAVARLAEAHDVALSSYLLGRSLLGYVPDAYENFETCSWSQGRRDARELFGYAYATRGIVTSETLERFLDGVAEAWRRGARP